VERYIEGYYCRNDFDLETLNKGSNRKIIDALHNAYPSGLTAKELALETGLPDKTVYPQIKSLSRQHFILKLGKEKESKSRGRPTFKKNTDVTAQRARGQVIIENANRLFDTHEGKEGRESPLPPGNVEYYGPFIQLWDELAEREELEGLTMTLLRFIKTMVTRTYDSEDDTIHQIAPTKNLEYCCSQCGLNHEGRDFIRALSLSIIDELEKSEPYLYFLREYNFITEEAFKNALAKIPRITKPRKESSKFRKTVAYVPTIEDVEGIGPMTARKLREAGYSSVKYLAMATIEDLAVDINCTKDSAKSFIMAAKKILGESN
jgi:hypothetical protein